MPGSPSKGKRFWVRINRFIKWTLYYYLLKPEDRRWVLHSKHHDYQPGLTIPKLHQMINRSTLFIFVRNAVALSFGGLVLVELAGWPVKPWSVFGVSFFVSLITVLLAASK